MVAAALVFLCCLGAQGLAAAPAPAPAVLPAPARVPAPSDVAAPPPGAQKLRSGVAMKVLARGHGKDRPLDNDCVKAHYKIWKRDGTLLSSTGPSSELASQCLGSMFPGLAEAMKKMVVGEQRRVWVPADLTYVGDEEETAAKMDVTFDVELLEIIKAPPLPRDLKSPPRSATRTPSGLVIRVLKKGTGTEHPSAKKRVKLDFTGWTAKGKLIETTVMGGQPAVYELPGVMPGWREALMGMVQGDKVRIWIPTSLAFGDNPRRGQPKGPLVYELELLSIDAP